MYVRRNRPPSSGSGSSPSSSATRSPSLTTPAPPPSRRPRLVPPTGSAVCISADPAFRWVRRRAGLVPGVLGRYAGAASGKLGRRDACSTPGRGHSIMPGDPAGHGRGEEHARVGDVLRLTQPVQGRRALPAFDAVRPVLAQPGARDETGRDRVDPHAVTP